MIDGAASCVVGTAEAGAGAVAGENRLAKSSGVETGGGVVAHRLLVVAEGVPLDVGVVREEFGELCGGEHGAVPEFGEAAGECVEAGDDTEAGVCDGNGSVQLSEVTQAVPVTVAWATLPRHGVPGVATSDADFVSASGIVTFAPGETVQHVSVEVMGDTLDEAPLLWGEWGFVALSDPVGATIDTSRLYGLGIFVIVDDD